MYNIVKAPDPILTQVAKPVNKIDASILDLIERMKQTLFQAKDPEGVGLAAPQVGKSLQLFIVRQTETSPVLVFLNPTIIDFTDRKPHKTSQKNQVKDIKLEGCLSLRNIWGVVKRHNSLRLAYTDLTGKKHEKTFNGFLATIIQHEVDHLNGILFTQRVLEQKGKLYRSKKNEEGETVFEEMQI
jgi:peptide deformylase